MKFTTMAVAVNQLDIKDVEAIQHTTELLRKVIDHYGEEAVLCSPNTGEIIQTAEIPCVLGFLDFFLQSRVVEVNPNWG
jgi:hypothetical protein